jgi:hypothetical protein
MAPRLNRQGGFRNWTLEIPAWLVLVALLLAPPAALLFGRLAVGLSNNDAEHDFPLTRNEVVTDGGGNRTWHGAFLNITGDEYREVEAVIRFLDGNNRPVGDVRREVARLGTRESLPLEAPLPQGAVRMQVYSLQRRTGPLNLGKLFGPYRPWEFGYVMAEPEAP